MISYLLIDYTKLDPLFNRLVLITILLLAIGAVLLVYTWILTERLNEKLKYARNSKGKKINTKKRNR